MTAGKLSFRFSSRVVIVDQGVRYHALPVPRDIVAAWKKAKLRRFVGTINGQPIKRALISQADGGGFFIVSRALMKAAGISGRKPATLDFKPDPAPLKLEMPEEFAVTLNQDAAAKARWDTFTTGRQRSLLSYITGAKTEGTRIKRSLELARLIRTHSLYGDKKDGPSAIVPGRTWTGPTLSSGDAA